MRALVHPIRLLPFFLLAAMPLPRSHGQAPPSPLEATLDVREKFRDGASLVWTPAGNATWKSLLDFHQVDRIFMTPRSLTAEALNDLPLEVSKIAPPGTLVIAGEDSAAFRDQVRESLRKHAGGAAAAAIGPFAFPRNRDQQAAALRGMRPAFFLCSISCQPRFAEPFMPDASARLFTDRKGQSHPVLGFGTSGRYASRYAYHSRVLADDLQGNHTLRLDFSKNEGDDPQFLVLSAPGKHQSLEDAIKAIRTLIETKASVPDTVEKDGTRYRYTSMLEAGDELWVPCLKAKIACDYPDLTQKKYLETPKGDQSWEIAEASQLLQLTLGHEGAIVQAAVQMAAEPFGPAGPSATASPAVLPRYVKRFIFNKPFIATLWRKDASWPYLACWVDGPGLLVEKK